MDSCSSKRLHDAQDWLEATPVAPLLNRACSTDQSGLLPSKFAKASRALAQVGSDHVRSIGRRWFLQLLPSDRWSGSSTTKTQQNRGGHGLLSFLASQTKVDGCVAKIVDSIVLLCASMDEGALFVDLRSDRCPPNRRSSCTLPKGAVCDCRRSHCLPMRVEFDSLAFAVVHDVWDASLQPWCVCSKL